MCMEHEIVKKQNVEAIVCKASICFLPLFENQQI